jgi:MFS family permease
VQTSAAFGLFGALLVILITRTLMETYLPPGAFEAWGWRIPFGVSIGLLGVSVWMRLKLTESPAFAAMEKEGTASKAPYAEAFGKWSNLRLVLLAFFGLMCAQGGVWYTTFFYSQTFLDKFLRLAPATINSLLMAATAVSAVFYVAFGALSDRIGRKPVMIGGMLLALAFYFPGFHMMERAANPALAEATARAPVEVIADPADCALQFDPVGKSAFVSSCDLIKTVLANAGVSYENRVALPHSTASMRVGATIVVSQSAAGLPKAEAKTVRARVEAAVKAALAKAGYPAKADPARVDFWKLLGILCVFAVAATALFGPLAASLVELFPTRIRYTALSLPYHIGTGWVGGFVPFTAFAIVAATGDIYAGLWYPFGFTAISVVVSLIFLPETKGRPLDT